MIRNIKNNTFDFEYTGSHYTEKKAIKNGFKQLTGKELKDIISNKNVHGEYPGGYKFISKIYNNGIAEGINDIGSYDIGNWSIDYESDTLHLKWKNTWLHTITRSYIINNTIEFYDSHTGIWRTTFIAIKNLKP